MTNFSVLEKDRLILIDMDAVFYVELYCFHKHTTFYIFSFTNEVLDCITMIATNDILGENRTFVQIIGDIVTRCTDELDSPVKGSLIGVGSYEGWQKAMMDIDDTIRIFRDKEWFENLHVPCQNQEVDFPAYEFEYALLILMVRCTLDREIMVW